ncbi:MAG: hypothetical protein LC729_00015 [Acidobacteria bacterium]|nr:hypothetical protein [Acidobacteriota bacterium]
MSVQLNKETLLDPPFTKDPPLKVNINAKTLGLVLAILSAIVLLFGVLALPVLFAASAVGAALGVPVAQIFVLVLLGTVISLLGTVLVAWGGYRMYREDRGGKALVIYGLALHVVGGLVSALGGLSASAIVGWIVGTAVTFCLYYLVVVSRFPGEAPLVPTSATPGPPQAPIR